MVLSLLSAKVTVPFFHSKLALRSLKIWQLLKVDSQINTYLLKDIVHLLQNVIWFTNLKKLNQTDEGFTGNSPQWDDPKCLKSTFLIYYFVDFNKI